MSAYNVHCRRSEIPLVICHRWFSFILHNVVIFSDCCACSLYGRRSSMDFNCPISPASSLCVEANEPPLYFRRKKLSLQYCLKLSSNYNNPAYATVFNSKFHSVFERKPTQLPPLAMRVSGDLQAIGFKKVMLLHLLCHPHRLGF